MSRKKTPSELEFFSLFENSTWSTEQEDMFQHIDLRIDEMTVDVKGLKKTNRGDSNVDASIHWVEFQNVNGDKGWIYGQATHIAFEIVDAYILLEREVLYNFCKEKIVDRKVKDTKGLYTLYRRKGRNDVITMILTEDILKLPHVILNKKVSRETN